MALVERLIGGIDGNVVAAIIASCTTLFLSIIGATVYIVSHITRVESRVASIETIMGMRGAGGRRLTEWEARQSSKTAP